MALPARTLRGALTAAHNRGTTKVELTLITNERMSFVIEEVIDDALIGQRFAGRAMLVPYHAIASIEFS